jgi:sialic acid synthase SpsE
MRIRVGDREVGDGAATFIVAAIGSNHDGSFERAGRLIDLAAAAGADAVKFQSYRAVSLLTRRSRRADGGWQTVEDYPTVERLELPVRWHAPLRDHARARGMAFLSSPGDEGRASLLAALGVPALRIASGDLTHVPLLETVAGFGRPVLLSTGFASEEEIADALAALERGAGGRDRCPPVVLLHCVALRPLRADDANLRALRRLRDRFGCLTGWSDHSQGQTLALGAVALGACVVEKHLTDDPGRPGGDHLVSMTPDAFAAMVGAVREIERALGDGRKVPHRDEAGARAAARRSVHAARSLPAGSVLEEADLKVVRPATGDPPASLSDLVGCRLVRRLAVDEPVRAAECVRRS